MAVAISHAYGAGRLEFHGDVTDVIFANFVQYLYFNAGCIFFFCHDVQCHHMRFSIEAPEV